MDEAKSANLTNALHCHPPPGAPVAPGIRERGRVHVQGVREGEYALSITRNQTSKRRGVQAMIAIGFADVGTGMLEGPQRLGGGRFYYLKVSDVTYREVIELH